jgi:DNA-binding IclR family transcriptional regulator
LAALSDPHDELDPEDAERVRRRGYAVRSQRAFDRVDCAAAPVRVAAGRSAQTNGLP